MDNMINLTRWLAGKLNSVSGFCLVGMMVLSCMDIILRFFRMPIPGTYEIVSFLSAIMLSFAMAQTTLDRAHVSVEILVSKLPKKIRQGIYIITTSVTLILLATISIESFKYGNFFKESGELSLTLQLPFYPILYGMGVAFFISCLIPIVDILMVIFKNKDSWFLWDDDINPVDI